MKNCVKCDKLIKDQDNCLATFSFRYKALKSKVVFAIDQGSLEYMPDTLRHLYCEPE